MSPLSASMDRRRHDHARVEIDRMFGLVGKMRRAVLHLGDLGVRIGLARPIFVRQLLAFALAVEPDQVVDRRRLDAALLGHPRQHLAIGLAIVAAHDRPQRGVGLHRRAIDANALALHQTALGDELQDEARTPSHALRAAGGCASSTATNDREPCRASPSRRKSPSDRESEQRQTMPRSLSSPSK